MMIVDLEDNEEHTPLVPTVFSLTKRARLDDFDWLRYLDTLNLRNEAVRHALRSVQRELFVPSRFQHLTYQPVPIPLGYNRHMESVFDVARLMDVAEISPVDKLLEVGTGSGYQTALLSMMVPSPFVSIDENEAFVEDSVDRLHQDLNMRHISILHSEDEAWRANQDEYDAIIYGGLVQSISEDILSRLAINGRILATVANPMTGERHIIRITKTPTCIVQEVL